MSIEAMKLALEALEPWSLDAGHEIDRKAVEALRAAIEQAEKQEPVAWTPKIDRTYDENGMLISQKIKRTPSGEWEDYYPAPQREWQGLTDEEIENCMEMSIQRTCRTIEAKLKAKNYD